MISRLKQVTDLVDEFVDRTLETLNTAHVTVLIHVRIKGRQGIAMEQGGDHGPGIDVGGDNFCCAGPPSVSTLSESFDRALD